MPTAEHISFCPEVNKWAVWLVAMSEYCAHIKHLVFAIAQMQLRTWLAQWIMVCQSKISPRAAQVDGSIQTKQMAAFEKIPCTI